MKKGDKIIYIDNKKHIYFNLEPHKIYTVKDVIVKTYGNAIGNYYIISLENEKGSWYSDRFISLKQYRKLKLIKLYETL